MEINKEIKFWYKHLMEHKPQMATKNNRELAEIYTNILNKIKQLENERKTHTKQVCNARGT